MDRNRIRAHGRVLLPRCKRPVERVRGLPGCTVVCTEGAKRLARRSQRRYGTGRRLVVDVVVDQAEIEGIAGREQGVKRHHEKIVLTIRRTAGGVVDVLTTLSAGCGQFDRQSANFREVDQTFEILLAVLRKGADQLAAPLTRGLGANHVDQTTNGVAAKQRALRAAQDFHTLRIPHIQQSACGGREVNAVLVDRNGRVKTLFDFRVLHATDRDANRAITQNRVDDEVGGHARDLIDRSGERFLDGVGVHG